MNVLTSDWSKGLTRLELKKGKREGLLTQKLSKFNFISFVLLTEMSDQQNSISSSGNILPLNFQPRQSIAVGMQPR